LAIAGIGAGEAIRAAVLVGVTEAVRSAQQEGAFSGERGTQIARHLRRVQNADVRIAA
jgi:hypothetical protein